MKMRYRPNYVYLDHAGMPVDEALYTGFPIPDNACRSALQPMSPRTAIAITNAVNHIAVALEQLAKENAELKKRLEEKQAPEIKDK